jgi:hypothetical protein
MGDGDRFLARASTYEASLLKGPVTIRTDFVRRELYVSFRKKLAHVGNAALVALFAISFASAQYSGQAKPKDKGADIPPVMRSVVVVEWTGDIAKPNASRVIPISVWDGTQLQDGGIFLSRPQPLALDSGVEYELQQNGKNVGLFDIEEAARQQNTWIGFGKYKKPAVKLSADELARMSAKIKIDAGDEYSDAPVLHRKQHPDENGGSAPESGQKNAPADPDRPTLHRGGDSGGDDGSTSNKTSAPNGGGPTPDPDRPKLHQDAGNGGSQSGDPDRPRLNNTPPPDEEAHVSSLPDVADPNRPRLKRGVPEGLETAVDPSKVETSLMNAPAEMKQQVGVSDSRQIKEHTWEFTWADPDDQRKMKEAVEEAARKALGLAEPSLEPPAPKRTATTTAHRTPVKPTQTPEPPKLLDEQFRIYELAYGGGVTMVFSARTDGVGADQKFVTIVAQPDLYGSVVVILKSVTDVAHLDVKPRMRLIDAVDAEGDNRGDLLFELRGGNQRQFALYRVLRGQASQIFETTATFYGSAGE